MRADIYASGTNCQGKAWRVGIKELLDEYNISKVLHLSNSAVTTSGDYERFVQIQGKKFSHIINPLTGYPHAKVISASVIAPTTIEADVLATALCVLEEEDSQQLMNQLGGKYASFIFFRDGDLESKIIKTDSLDNYLK